MARVLFVCAGNICRSPMAEALLKERVAGLGISGFDVSSCGLQANPWTGADPRLRLVLGSAYRFLKDFHSMPASPELVEGADLILTMEERHVRDIMSKFPHAKGKVYTVTSFAGENGEIRDFLDGERGDFLQWLKEVYSTLDRCMARVIDGVLKAGFSQPSRL